MRKIKYRGKQMKNGKWIYGFYFEIEHNDDKSHVHGYITANPLLEKMPKDVASFIEIYTNTIGQFIGFSDINDKEIYEGDILRCEDTYDLVRDFVGVVDFADASFRISNNGFTYYRWQDYRVEVIGNIYENPELLEVE